MLVEFSVVAADRLAETAGVYKPQLLPDAFTRKLPLSGHKSTGHARKSSIGGTETGSTLAAFRNIGRWKPLIPHHPNKGGFGMDWNRVEGNWKQVKGQVKEKWGKLTDDDLDVVAGKRDQLEGKIQERYGIAKDQVQKDIDDWYGTQKW
jgi:uncharacterized protein YjbJ (UPF0337 family)